MKLLFPNICWSVGGLLVVTVLQGCHGNEPPTGQVVAKVNGDDITKRDVQAELAEAQAGRNLDMKKVQPLVVDSVVNRKLFVEEAERQKLDKSPEFLAASERARELVLAKILAARIEAKITPPTQDDITRFIGDNPAAFSDRKLFEFDQVRTLAQGIDQSALKPLNTMDQVIAWLQANKHIFQRGTVGGDSAKLPKEVVNQIEALPPGMPFVLNQGGVMIISAVAASKLSPIPEAQWRETAAQALMNQNRNKALKTEIDGLRASSKIQYQAGFGPPAKPGS